VILRVSVEKSKSTDVYRNSTKLYRTFICIFIEVSAKNQFKIQFLGRRFDVFVSRVRKKILIFLGNVIFLS
jgi:hypothetical protein